MFFRQKLQYHAESSTQHLIKLPFVRTLNCSRHNTPTYLSIREQLFASKTSTEKERQYQRLASSHGYVPGDEILHHLLLSHTAERNYSRVLMLLQELGSSGRRPLPEEIVEKLATSVGYLHTLLWEGQGRIAPHIAEDLLLPLWRVTLDLVTRPYLSNCPLQKQRASVLGRTTLRVATNKTLYNFSMDILQCLSLLGCVPGMKILLMGIMDVSEGFVEDAKDYEAVYRKRGAAPANYAHWDEILSIVIYGLRVSGDDNFLHILEKMFPSLTRHPFQYPKASLYFCEALLFGRKHQEAREMHCQLMRSVKPTGKVLTGDKITSCSESINLSDIELQLKLQDSTMSSAELQNYIMTELDPSVQGSFGEKSVNGIDVKLSLAVEELARRRGALSTLYWLTYINSTDSNKSGSFIQRIFTCIPAIPRTLQVLCEALLKSLKEKNVVSCKGRNSDLTRKLSRCLYQFRSVPVSTSYNESHAANRRTFACDTIETVETLLHTLLDVGDIEEIYYFMLHLSETSFFEFFDPSLYVKISAAARDHGHYGLCGHMRFCRALVRPLDSKILPFLRK